MNFLAALQILPETYCRMSIAGRSIILYIVMLLEVLFSRNLFNFKIPNFLLYTENRNLKARNFSPIDFEKNNPLIGFPPYINIYQLVLFLISLLVPNMRVGRCLGP
jgi:hypothetical protein